MFKDVFKLLG